MSLLDLLGALPPGVDVAAACPPGELDERLRRMGVATTPIPAVDAGFRLDLRHTPSGVAAAGRGAVIVMRLARRRAVHVVHANSVRAALIAVAAARLGAPRPTAHVRDFLPHSAAGRLVRGIVNHGAAALVTNSAATAAQWGPTTLPTTVAIGPVDIDRFDPARVDRAAARRDLGVADGGGPVLTVLAQLTPWKGQDLAIEVTARLRPRWPGVQLLIAGDVAFDSPATTLDNRTYASSLRSRATAPDVDGSVRFLGRKDDVPAVLAATDVLLVPSWHEPMGRTVLEALAMGVPVAATDQGGPAEVLTDPALGTLIPPRDVSAWTAAVGELLSRPASGEDERRRLSRAFAVRYAAPGYAGAVVGAWRAISGSAGRSPASR
jgi:glycosyltransferase involved in cell wall biosynthesis